MSYKSDDVGRRVRAERQKAGLSLAQLADSAGLTKAYLVRLEQRGGNPTLAALSGIAEALDLTIADLIGGPKIVFDDADEADLPSSLRAYADEAKLTSADVRTLASIKWRRGERPQTPERWRYIHDSLHLSRSLEEPHGDDDE